MKYFSIKQDIKTIKDFLQAFSHRFPFATKALKAIFVLIKWPLLIGLVLFGVLFLIIWIYYLPQEMIAKKCGYRIAKPASSLHDNNPCVVADNLRKSISENPQFGFGYETNKKLLELNEMRCTTLKEVDEERMESYNEWTACEKEIRDKFW